VDVSTVIRAESVSKKYIIGHQRKDAYGTLRESLADGVKNTTQRLLHPFHSSSGQPLTGLSTTEELWALKDVSFEVQQGDRIGIIGRNGAGKTTLLKILSRITEPTEGKISLRGRVASLLEVGTGFHPELTGRENIFLNGAILGMTRLEIKMKFDEIVDFAEVERFLDTPVKRYSSGMYVRLAFAVAAHLEPEILIVDEVLAVGDVQFQRKCLGKMDAVSREGRTVLFVSHNLPAVLRLCSRGLFLSEGSLTMDSDVHQAVHKYLASSQVIDPGSSLDELPRDGNLGESVRFSKCSLRDSKGAHTSSLMFGEPFSVKLELISKREISDLSIIVRIESNTGESIAGPASEDDSVFFSISPSRPLRISAGFSDFVLTPDSYWITIAVRCGRVGHDQVLKALGFEVLQSPYRDQKPHSGTWGYVHVSPRWEEEGY